VTLDEVFAQLMVVAYAFGAVGVVQTALLAVIAARLLTR